MTEPPAPPPAPLDGPSFLHRLQIVTASVLLAVLLLHLLRELRDILQPLFIAFFIAYLILPAHGWLVRHGIAPRAAIVVFLIIVFLVLWALSFMVRANIEQALTDSPRYEARVKTLIEKSVAYLPMEREAADKALREWQQRATENVTNLLRTAVGMFLDFLTWMFVVFIYLVFLLAERVSLPERLRRAFGEVEGTRVLGIVASINEAIAQYIAVKTLVSVLAGASSYVVLIVFGVDFAIMWGILIFLLNFIPYLGSLVATALPIALSFVQFDQPWIGIVIGVLLIGIQQGIGMVIEPRMAGHKLGVSPLLILLSLAFWGLVWGVVGMILAVPLLVTVKIILDNIPETKPVATLMSNV